jgi:hypothetical protein
MNKPYIKLLGESVRKTDGIFDIQVSLDEVIQLRGNAPRLPVGNRWQRRLEVLTIAEISGGK